MSIETSATIFQIDDFYTYTIASAVALALLIGSCMKFKWLPRLIRWCQTTPLFRPCHKICGCGTTRDTTIKKDFFATMNRRDYIIDNIRVKSIPVMTRQRSILGVKRGNRGSKGSLKGQVHPNQFDVEDDISLSTVGRSEEGGSTTDDASPAEDTPPTTATDSPPTKQSRSVIRQSIIAITSFFKDDTTDAIQTNQCGICLHEFGEGEEISSSQNPLCTDRFHKECIIEWLMDTDKCPLCHEDYVPPGGGSLSKRTINVPAGDDSVVSGDEAAEGYRGVSTVSLPGSVAGGSMAPVMEEMEKMESSMELTEEGVNPLLLIKKSSKRDVVKAKKGMGRLTSVRF